MFIHRYRPDFYTFALANTEKLELSFFNFKTAPLNHN